MTVFQRSRSLLAISILLFSTVYLKSPVQEARCQTPVNFQTEDGWTIRGDLYLPQPTTTAPVSAAVLLSEPGGTDRSIYDTYLGPDLAQAGVAALSIDFRGTGSSFGKKTFENFSRKELEALQLDIKAAVSFLASQKNVDSARIGLVGPGLGATYALLEASENSAIQALVLISGTVSPQARETIAFRKDLPILFMAGEKDKDAFREMSEAYLLSANAESGFVLGAGHGPIMFTHTGGLKERVAGWLARNLNGLGIEREVSFQSKDGWTLHGTLRLPQRAGKNSKVAGVVLAHGARHEQQAYYDLSRDLVKDGIASLTFDWRGKGKSIDEKRWAFTAANLGSITDKDELGRIYVDIQAALDFLSSQEAVEGERLGLVGATLACPHAIRAAAGDSRIKTLALLTCGGFRVEEIKPSLSSIDAPMLVVAGLDDTHWDPAHSGSGNFAEDSRQIYLLSKNRYSQLLLYTRAGHGSEMFKVHPELERIVLRWLTEKLQ